MDSTLSPRRQQGQNMFLPPMPPPADGVGLVLDLSAPPAPFSSSEAVDALPEARLSSSTPNGTPRKTGRKERGHHSVFSVPPRAALPTQFRS